MRNSSLFSLTPPPKKNKKYLSIPAPHPFPLHLLKIRVWPVGAGDFVAVHYCDEVFGVALCLFLV